MDNIDFKVVVEVGVKVFNILGLNLEVVVEFSISMVLVLVRRILEIDR